MSFIKHKTGISIKQLPCRNKIYFYKKTDRAGNRYCLITVLTSKPTTSFAGYITDIKRMHE